MYKILSIDGGGIRGIIPGQILVRVEKLIQEETNNPNARIADFFDFVAGTSTGGILACAHLMPDNKGKPRYSAQEVVNLYLERGGDIFDIPFRHRIRSAGGVLDEKYPSKGIEKALKDYMGNVELKDALKDCLITSFDIKRMKAHFFTRRDTDNASGNYLMRDVSRATSAAPTYFEVSNIKSMSGVSYPLVDGGVFANNPSMCAYAEVRDQSKIRAKEMMILSLGTGHSQKSYDYDDAKDWGMAGWVKPVIDVMMTGVADTVHYQINQIYEAVGAEDQYLRINPELTKDVNPDMDDAEKENMQALKELGQYTAEDRDIDAKLRAFVKKAAGN